MLARTKKGVRNGAKGGSSTRRPSTRWPCVSAVTLTLALIPRHPAQPRVQAVPRAVRTQLRSRFKRGGPAVEDRVTRDARESAIASSLGYTRRGRRGVEGSHRRPWSDPNQGRRRRRPFLLAFLDFPPPLGRPRPRLLLSYGYDSPPSPIVRWIPRVPCRRVWLFLIVRDSTDTSVTRDFRPCCPTRGWARLDGCRGILGLRG